jgi:2-polyprenyl-3-methyl-5-hydroxy-6-metoxy-1,4-benzoquinol methylase
VEKVTDWILLWKELVEWQSKVHKKEKTPKDESDYWRGKARSFDDGVKQRWARPDFHRDFILSMLKANQGSTVLDVGAGTGGWAIPMARLARKVTAIEPSSEMIRFMTENLRSEGISNVEIVQASWPEGEKEIGTHDFSLCSHAMYGCPDLPSFVRAMGDATRKICLMLIRAPSHDGIMAKAAMRIWGHPHGSPNFQVAYGAMLQMGIYPHVYMGTPDQWEPRTSASPEEAVAEVKRRFGLPSHSEHDGFLQNLIESRLTFQEGKYVWPREVRSALIYWDGDQESLQTDRCD